MNFFVGKIEKAENFTKFYKFSHHPQQAFSKLDNGRQTRLRKTPHRYSW